MPKRRIVRVQAVYTLQQYLRGYSMATAMITAKCMTVKQIRNASMEAAGSRCCTKDSKQAWR